jgi:hypothetical protein
VWRAHRLQHRPLPPTQWLGPTKTLSTQPPRRRVANGSGYVMVRTDEISNAELGERLVEIAHDEDDGQAKTGRRFYYLALSYGYVAPDMSATPEGRKSREAAYDRVIAVLGTLRKAGMLDWEAVLDLTREIVQWQTYQSPREARARLRRTYDEDRWLGQKFYPILIVEKDTLDPVCRPMASTWQMPFASSRGYGSLTLQRDTAKMLRDRRARTGQAAVVLFVSDHDPSGFDLERAWREVLDHFNVRIAGFVRIGLTRDQVDALDKPRLRQGIEVKPSDSRAAAYIEEHGDRCWEADIVPAAVLEAAIDAEIRLWLDATAWNRRDAEIEAARRLI